MAANGSYSCAHSSKLSVLRLIIPLWRIVWFGKDLTKFPRPFGSWKRCSRSSKTCARWNPSIPKMWMKKEKVKKRKKAMKVFPRSVVGELICDFEDFNSAALHRRLLSLFVFDSFYIWKHKTISVQSLRPVDIQVYISSEGY